MKQIIFCSVLASCALLFGCASGGGTVDEEQPSAVTKQHVYYGDLYGNGIQPGTPDNGTCGPHSAIGYLDDGCSGTLVRNNIVITAHHCLPHVGSKFYFRGTK